MTLIHSLATVRVDYDEPNAIQNAITAAHLNGEILGMSLADSIPLTGTGQAERLVHELHLDDFLTTSGVLAAVNGYERTFADPLTFLRYVAGLEGETRPYSLATFFKKGDELWCMIWHHMNGGHDLFVHAVEPDHRWTEKYRFLVEYKQ